MRAVRPFLFGGYLHSFQRQRVSPAPDGASCENHPRIRPYLVVAPSGAAFWVGVCVSPAAKAATAARDSTVPDASSRRGADRIGSPRSIVVGRGVLTAHDRFAAASPVDMQSSFNATLV